MQTILKATCVQTQRKSDEEYGTFESATFKADAERLVYVELPDAISRFTVGAEYDIAISAVHPITGA